MVFCKGATNKPYSAALVIQNGSSSNLSFIPVIWRKRRRYSFRNQFSCSPIKIKEYLNMTNLLNQQLQNTASDDTLDETWTALAELKKLMPCMITLLFSRSMSIFSILTPPKAEVSIRHSPRARHIIWMCFFIRKADVVDFWMEKGQSIRGVVELIFDGWYLIMASKSDQLFIEKHGSFGAGVGRQGKESQNAYLTKCCNKRERNTSFRCFIFLKYIFMSDII